jgi:ketosteroid isomerase-like protein
MMRGDADAIAEPYSIDALFVTVNGETIRGRAAIKEFYRTRLGGDGRIISATIEHRGAATGDRGLVFERGFATVTTQVATGKVGTRSGPYFTVWNRVTGGSWEILRNVVL